MCLEQATYKSEQGKDTALMDWDGKLKASNIALYSMSLAHKQVYALLNLLNLSSGLARSRGFSYSPCITCREAAVQVCSVKVNSISMQKAICMCSRVPTIGFCNITLIAASLYLQGTGQQTYAKGESKGVCTYV